MPQTAIKAHRPAVAVPVSHLRPQGRGGAPTRHYKPSFVAASFRGILYRGREQTPLRKGGWVAPGHEQRVENQNEALGRVDARTNEHSGCERIS